MPSRYELFSFLVLFVFPMGLAFAAAMDLLTMTIPNRISLVLVVAFLLASAALPLSLIAFANHIGAGVTMLAVGLGMFALGWLGGGDAKLIAVCALWFGFDQLMNFLLTAMIGGGLLAISILTYRSMLPPPWLARQSWALRLHGARTGIPCGIALAGAALWLHPSPVWMERLSVGNP